MNYWRLNRGHCKEVWIQLPSLAEVKAGGRSQFVPCSPDKWSSHTLLFKTRQGKSLQPNFAPISFLIESTDVASKKDCTWARCCCCLASTKFRRNPSSLSSLLARMLNEWAAAGTFLFLSCSTASLALAKSSAREWPNASWRCSRASSYLPVG